MGDGMIMEVLRHGWWILSIMAAASIATWTILLDRWMAIRYARSDARAFMDHIMELLKTDGHDNVLERCRRSRKPVARIAATLLEIQGDHHKFERTLKYAIQEIVHELQARVSVLASIGSMAPYVGLLGTVVGIIRAFHDISQNTGGGPEVVAAGISEALVSTAAGLLVAIPAIAAFNYCVHQIQTFAEQLEMAAQPLVESLVARSARMGS